MEVMFTKWMIHQVAFASKSQKTLDIYVFFCASNDFKVCTCCRKSEQKRKKNDRVWAIFCVIGGASSNRRQARKINVVKFIDYWLCCVVDVLTLYVKQKHIWMKLWFIWFSFDFSSPINSCWIWTSSIWLEWNSDGRITIGLYIINGAVDCVDKSTI